MGSEAFIDTSGFYAMLVKKDEMHPKAGEILSKAARQRSQFVTSDYVIDETATLVKARGHLHLLPKFLDTVYRSEACRVEWMDPDRFEKTLSLFLKHIDHAWSFTDCFSFVLMKELRIREAVTKDSHFREAGFIPLLA